jgi:hypothetical protein
MHLRHYILSWFSYLPQVSPRTIWRRCPLQSQHSQWNIKMVITVETVNFSIFFCLSIFNNVIYRSWWLWHCEEYYGVIGAECERCWNLNEFRCSYREIWLRYVYMPLHYMSTIFHRYYSSYHHLFPCGDCVTDSFTLRRYPQFSNFQWKSQYIRMLQQERWEVFWCKCKWKREAMRFRLPPFRNCQTIIWHGHRNDL